MSKALTLLDKNQFEDATKALMDIDRQGLETALAMGINIPAQVLQRSKGVSLTVAAAAEKTEENEKAEGANDKQKNISEYDEIEKERMASAQQLKREADIQAGPKNKIPYATFIPRGVHTNISFIMYLKGDYE